MKLRTASEVHAHGYWKAAPGAGGLLAALLMERLSSLLKHCGRSLLINKLKPNVLSNS